MTKRLEDELQRIIAAMDTMDNEACPNQEHDQPGTTGRDGAPGAPETNAETTSQRHTETPPDDIQDVYVLIVRERRERGKEEAAEEEEKEPPQVVESTLALPRQPSQLSWLPAYALCCGYLLLIISTLAFQLYRTFNPPIATVTIIPNTQQVTVTGTVQLGRLLHPVTISQTQAVPTTGMGHQDARSATGYLTLYNGQFQPVLIAAGTLLTGNSGIGVVTDQDAQIPAGNPPRYGRASVPAHATSPGRAGNIEAFDINHACCAPSVLVQNTQPFTGGQDKRTFQTVAQRDIDTIATPLKTAVTQGINGAFQSQRTSEERVFLLPCHPGVTSDHQVGQEATQVKVTVSATCRAVAYNSQQVATAATSLLAPQAQHSLGTGYSVLGEVQVSMQQATVTGRAKVFLSFSASGTWVYGLSRPAQAYITHLLAGKTTQAAMHLLARLPGVEQTTIHFTGFGDTARLPWQSSLIHLVFLVM